MAIAQDEVVRFFDRYARVFNDGLNGALDVPAQRSLYATQFIAAGPGGVMTGDNDDAFGDSLAEGYARYRQIGTRAMEVTGVAVHPIDDCHCLAHVGWNSVYEKDGRRIEIPFTNTYLLANTGDGLKVFGWITGDEMQVLKDHGLV